MPLLIIITILFILYGSLIIFCWIAWKAIPGYQASVNPITRLSVIIPARNEEKQIGNLLSALNSQSYPREFFEVIVVDDHSTDATVKVIQSFPGVKIISLSEEGINSYKKKAIETGIAYAQHEWIVTTDADCIPPSGWLKLLAAMAEERSAVLIAAPVMIEPGRSLLEIFQSMDFLVLQGITAALVSTRSLSMANGANLAYEKKAFYAVDGFKGIDHIASGDDMLLMHKISTMNPTGIHYLKSKLAIVSTGAMKSWKEFFNQRIRWASKAAHYRDKRMLPVLLLVYLLNLSFPILIIAGIWNYFYLYVAVILWVAKTVVELPFFISISRFFGKPALAWLLFFFQPLHIFYTIISGFFGQFGTYTWKGRTVK